MTQVAYIKAHVIPVAFSLLPSEMGTPNAAGMLAAIGYQESKFTARRQVGGPARSMWMFEERGGARGVLTHQATSGLLSVAWSQMGYLGKPTPYGLMCAIEHNDVLACVCARLLLWTLPDAMPGRDEQDAGWAQYLAAWRPGKPHKEQWPEAWMEAWS